LVVSAGPTACGVTFPAPDREPQAAARDARPSTYLVLHLNERRLYLMREDAGVPAESFPIAIGRAGHETPTGRFAVEEMVEHPDFDEIDPDDRSRVRRKIPPGPDNPLGERWLGFAHGDGWTVGIHGTPHPELLGKAVSGGCIRMRNADVIHVYDSVRLGTPVIVTP